MKKLKKWEKLKKWKSFEKLKKLEFEKVILKIFGTSCSFDPEISEHEDNLKPFATIYDT